MLGKRVLSAIVSLPLLFAAVIINRYIFYAALLIVGLIGLYEYFNAITGSGVRPMKLIGMISGLIVMFIMSNENNLGIFILFVTLLLLILMSVPIFSEEYNFIGAGATIVGIFYVPLLLSHLYFIRSIPEKGVYLIWFVFICSWVSDTCAYFTGMFFGKNKLCPRVSPKKTVEGSIGGIIGSTLACVIYGFILSMLGIVNIPVIHLILVGILGSIVSQFGDLAASSIKRYSGVKDYGKIMPGHGGILDRFDSILFVAPLIYYYITWVI